MLYGILKNEEGAIEHKPPPETCHCKVVLLGDSAVGKSCITMRFAKGEFHEYLEPTIGAAFISKSVISESTTVKFEIWDTAGQERYRSLAPMYYRCAGAALIVYDITSRMSFAGARTWVKELEQRGEPNMIIILVGNKLDKESKREIETEEAMVFANNNDIIHIEASAKTGENVNEIFTQIAEKFKKITRNKNSGSFPITPPHPIWWQSGSLC
jgi:Ras-related protein Rab-5C